MSPRFLFGFQFGSPTPSVATAAPPAPLWTTLTAFVTGWGHSRDTFVLPRFERIFPLPPTPVPAPVFAGNVNLVYEVKTQFPFIISSKNDVRIYSEVTVPVS